MGLMDLAGPVTWGIIQLHPEGDAVRFTMSIDLTGKSGHEITQIDAARIAAAVEAAVAANCDVAVRAHVEGMHRPNATGGLHVTKLLSTSWDVRVLAKTDADSVQRAAATAGLVLQGGRPHQLHNVYLLGLRAMQTIAPVVGLWAFTAVLEEAGTGKYNVDHVPQVALDLRGKGFSIPPDPIRHPAEIRAAALHSTPKSPMPSLDEVSWFRDVAWAYLCNKRSLTPTPLESYWQRSSRLRSHRCCRSQRPDLLPSKAIASFVITAAYRLVVPQWGSLRSAGRVASQMTGDQM